MRHEQLNVGKLTVEQGVYDEAGNAIITDSATNSATNSTADSKVTSNARWLTVLDLLGTKIAAGSVLASAISSVKASYVNEGTDLSVIISAIKS